MRLTTYTDYSLRLLMYLAARPGRRATIAEVAAAYGISQNHLTKVAHGLGRLGWLATVRGQGGGLELARPAHEVGIGQVVRGTEGCDLPAACFGEPPSQCTIERACRLRGVLAEAVEVFYAALDRHTLADLVQQPRELSRLLRIDAPSPRRRRASSPASA
jgi:Rrf2 family nitric oxide-sensitive transcriptional repressor